MKLKLQCCQFFKNKWNMSIMSFCNTSIIVSSNLLYLTVKRWFSPYNYLFSQIPGCFLFPLHFTFSNQDCADQIMPYIIPMQGSLLGFQHICAMHMSPGRQHNCIRLEVQQCIKPTSSLCQPGWFFLWLTGPELAPKKIITNSQWFQRCKIRDATKSTTIHQNTLGMLFCWIWRNHTYKFTHTRVNYSQIQSTLSHTSGIDHLTVWKNITRSYPKAGRNMGIWHRQTPQLSEFFKYTNCRKC